MYNNYYYLLYTVSLRPKHFFTYGNNYLLSHDRKNARHISLVRIVSINCVFSRDVDHRKVSLLDQCLNVGSHMLKIIEAIHNN